MRGQILSLPDKRAAATVKDLIKRNLHKDALIKELRDNFESDRRNKIHSAVNEFLSARSASDVDTRVNNLALQIADINEQVNFKIAADLKHTIETNNSLATKYPTIKEFFDLVRTLETSHGEKSRYALAIYQKELWSSINNSSKSNAGDAGNRIASAILQDIDLHEGRGFRREYSSAEGSDTDVVIPYLEDKNDHLVQIFMAVQFSTNDRIRLAKSELKSGATQMVFSLNGTEASTKKLKDIGTKLIRRFLSENTIIITYGPGITRERERLQKLPASAERDIRIKLFEKNQIWSIKQMQEYLKSRLNHSIFGRK